MKMRTLLPLLWSLLLISGAQAALADGFALVTNDSTTPEEIASWRTVAEWTAREITIFRMSDYGTGALPAQLLTDPSRRTIVILKPSHDGSARDLEAHKALEEPGFLKRVWQRGFRAYHVGIHVADAQKLFWNALYTGSEAEKRHFDSLDSFFETLESEPARPIGTTRTPTTDIVPIVQGHPSNASPKYEDIQYTADVVVQGRLSALYPDARFYVTYNFKPEVLSRSGGQTNWSMGTLSITRSHDLFISSVAFHAYQHEIHSPEFVLGDYNLYSFLLALDFTEKLELLEKIFDGTITEKSSETVARKLGPALSSALATDLVAEQRTLLDLPRKEAMSPEEIRAKLPRLEALVNHKFSKVRQPRSVAGRPLALVIAKVLYGTAAPGGLKGWWQSTLHTKSVRATTESILSQWSAQMDGGPANVLETTVQDELARLKEKSKTPEWREFLERITTNEGTAGKPAGRVYNEANLPRKYRQSALEAMANDPEAERIRARSSETITEEREGARGARETDLRAARRAAAKAEKAVK